MSFFEILHIEAETTPPMYGLFHIIFVIAALLVTFFVIKKAPSWNEKKLRVFLFIAWILIVFFETIKQLYFSTEVTESGVEWHYQWYVFPFQFCSVLHYLLPVLLLLKPSKVRDSVMSFLSTYSLFAGFIVFFAFADGVFIRSHWICMQTLVNHGLQFIVAAALIVYNRKKFNLRYFLSGVPVFAIMSVIALVLDLIMYRVIPETETFNMYCISPYYPSTLGLIGPWKEVLPYPVFLLIYIFGFTFAAFVFFVLARIPLLIAAKKRNRKYS